MPTSEEIIKHLNLQKHPEGGYFSETFRSRETTADPLRGNRAYSTAIYYMLTANTFSEMHRLITDEIFHFYLGDPVEMLHLYPDGTGKRVILGTDITQGMLPQVLVPAGVWQGSRLFPGGKNPGKNRGKNEDKNGYALMGTTMAPAFEYSDYLSGDRTELIRQYPEFKDLIIALTRKG